MPPSSVHLGGSLSSGETLECLAVVSEFATQSRAATGLLSSASTPHPFSHLPRKASSCVEKIRALEQHLTWLLRTALHWQVGMQEPRAVKSLASERFAEQQGPVVNLSFLRP